MCNAWPGTRCWGDTNDNYEKKVAEFEEIKKTHSEDSLEYIVAAERVAIALAKRDPRRYLTTRRTY
jgi:hypothetical protein